MPVAAQSSILSLSTDAPAPGPTGGAPAAEFGGLIAALAASGVKAMAAPDAVVATVEPTVTVADPAISTSDGESAAAADQLLALSCGLPGQARLVVRKPGTAVEARTSESEDGSEAEPDMPRCETEMPSILNGTPIAALPAPSQPIAAAQAPAVAQGEAPSKPIAAGSQLKAGPAPTPPIISAGQSDPPVKAAQIVPELAKRLQPKAAEPARDAMPQPDAHKPVQEAIRSLLAQALPSAARAKPAEAETSLVAPALKPAAALFTPTAFSVTEIAPRADAPLQTALAIEPETGELLIERQLDLAAGDEWLDTLAKDIARSAGDTPLRFRLNPENLGSLRVEIANDRGGASVRLTADTEAARAIIADAQPRLIAEARAQGVRISEAHVDLGQQPGSDANRRHSEATHEPQLRTARSVQEDGERDGKPTRGSSERYA